MYLAFNKHNPQEVHSFHWTPENKLIICGLAVNPKDWDIIEVVEVTEKSIEKPKEEILDNRLISIFIDGDWDTSHEDKGDTSPVRIFNKGKVVQIQAHMYEQYIDDLEERRFDCYFSPDMYAHPQWNGEIIYMKDAE
jgi:hypothetical protein